MTYCNFAIVAQLVERDLAKVEVRRFDPGLSLKPRPKLKWTGFWLLTRRLWVRGPRGAHLSSWFFLALPGIPWGNRLKIKLGIRRCGVSGQAYEISNLEGGVRIFSPAQNCSKGMSYFAPNGRHQTFNFDLAVQFRLLSHPFFSVLFGLLGPEEGNWIVTPVKLTDRHRYRPLLDFFNKIWSYRC